MFKKIKQLWNAFLIRLAKENQEEFGNRRANCCDLNKPRKGEQK